MSDNNQAENSKRESFDSDKDQLANVYAKSLLAAAGNAGTAGDAVDQLEAYVSDVLDKLPRLDQVLCSPRVSHEAKCDLIDKSAGGASLEFIRFLKVVAKHGRVDCIRAISSAARRLHSEASGRVEATAITATEVGESTRSDIQAGIAKMLGKDATVSYEIDPAIIGGLVVRVGDTVYDGSLANQLNTARQGVATSAAQIIRSRIDQLTTE